MDTSRSGERGWLAGVSILSGRPDPVWSVPAELGQDLAQRWAGWPPWSGRHPDPAPLGYRGCRLAAPDGRVWSAYNELVTLDAAGKRDVERVFERTIVSSAPAGTLPPIAL
jgi:hypothetical protein